MSVMDRRDFVKSLSIAAGAAALAGKTPLLAAKDKAVAPSSGVKNPYQVFALKYMGPAERKLAMFLFNTGWAEDHEINYYIWAIRDQKGETTLVDTGTGNNWPKMMNIKNFTPPEQLVERLGVKPEQVTKVVLTHMHFDHAGGMETFPQLYPKAKFYIQKKEFDFWVNSPLSQRPPYVKMQWPAGTKAVGELAKSSRLVIVNGDKVIARDMELLLAIGHTPGLQSVFIPTAKGPTIVGSDSAHLARSFKEDLPSGLITDMPAWLLTYDKLRSKAPIENIFPGHDTYMATSFPKVAEDITQLA